MKKILVPVMAIAFLLSAAAQAQAGCPMCGMLGKLDLGADQHKQVDKLKETMMAKVLPLKAQMGVKAAELGVLWVKDNPDRKAILAKKAEKAALSAQIQEARVDFKLALLKILTPEQRVKFLMHMGKGKDRGHMGGHEGCGGGDGGCPGGKCPMHQKMGEGHGMGMKKGPRK